MGPKTSDITLMLVNILIIRLIANFHSNLQKVPKVPLSHVNGVRERKNWRTSNALCTVHITVLCGYINGNKGKKSHLSKKA